MSVGGSFGGTAAVAVNVGVSVYSITTKAYRRRRPERAPTAPRSTPAATSASRPTRSSTST